MNKYCLTYYSKWISLMNYIISVKSSRTLYCNFVLHILVKISYSLNFKVNITLKSEISFSKIEKWAILLQNWLNFYFYYTVKFNILFTKAILICILFTRNLDIYSNKSFSFIIINRMLVFCLDICKLWDVDQISFYWVLYSKNFIIKS